jgi:hypothetical protein
MRHLLLLHAPPDWSPLPTAAGAACNTLTAGPVLTAGAACNTLTAGPAACAKLTAGPVLTAGAACSILNVGPNNSLSTRPSRHLIGMVTQCPSSPSRGPRQHATKPPGPSSYGSQTRRPPGRVWPCSGLECTSITAERKICQTTSINIRTSFYVINSALTLPEINIRSLSVHT